MTPRRRKATAPTRRGTARPEGVRRPSAVESGRRRAPPPPRGSAGPGRGGADGQRRRLRASLEVVPVLGAETFEALLADAVGEPHIPPAPRRDTVEERVATVPLMPRASADQHGAPPFDVASASGRIECKACAPACFRASGDLEVPTPRPARHFRAHEGKSLPARRPPPA